MWQAWGHFRDVPQGTDWCGRQAKHSRPGALTPVPLTLADLKKYRRYEVVMTAYNIIGESPASAPVEVFVGEAGRRWEPPTLWPVGVPAS